jgi:hypothetical protein
VLEIAPDAVLPDALDVEVQEGDDGESDRRRQGSRRRLEEEEKAEEVAHRDEDEERPDDGEVLPDLIVADGLGDQAAEERHQHLEEVLHAARALAVEALRREREEDGDQDHQEERHDRRVGQPGLLAVGKEEVGHPGRQFLDRRLAEEPDQQRIDRSEEE